MNNILLIGLMTGIVFFLPIYLWSWRQRKQQQTTDDMLAENVVNDILVQSGWSNRHRWIDDDTIEFLYLITGSQTEPKRHLIWTHVRITQTSMSARVEYAHGVGLETLEFARIVVKHMRKKKVDARLLRHPSEQPDLGETGVRLVERAIM